MSFLVTSLASRRVSDTGAFAGARRSAKRSKRRRRKASPVASRLCGRRFRRSGRLRCIAINERVGRKRGYRERGYARLREEERSRLWLIDLGKDDGEDLVCDAVNEVLDDDCSSVKLLHAVEAQRPTLLRRLFCRTENSRRAPCLALCRPIRLAATSATKNVQLSQSRRAGGEWTDQAGGRQACDSLRPWSQLSRPPFVVIPSA